MKIVIYIPNETYEKRETQKYLDEFNQNMGFIDRRITIDEYTDGEIEIKESENEILMNEFIDEDEFQEYVVLLPVDETLKEIIQLIEDNIYDVHRYAKLNGSFVNVEEVYAVKFLDTDGKYKIRFFAHIEHGICEEDGTDSIKYYTSSLWTSDGEFIECYD